MTSSLVRPIPGRKLRVYLANIGLRKPLYPLVTPPLGILYLAAYLRECFDVELKLLNQKLFNTSNEEIAREAIEFGADVVGLGAITPTASGLGKITHLVRASLPKSLICIGGPHVSSFGPDALNDTAANCAIAGEGEKVLEEVIRAYFDHGDLSVIPGIHYQPELGQIVTNPGSIPLINELDDLPFPAYDLIDIKPYFTKQSMPPIPRRKYISLFSSRGCPYECNYCHDVFGKRFRQHSAERVVAEIEYFHQQYGITDFEFVDDIFNLNPKRVVDVCQLLKQKNLAIKIAFPNGVRTDILREEGVQALVDSGMYFCSFALESGSPRIQQLMGKKLDIPRFLQGVKWATDRKVYANGFSMMGFPHEREEDLKLTMEVLCESTLHTASVFTVTPFPGTQLYEEAKRIRPEMLEKVHQLYGEMNLAQIMINFSDVPDEVLYHYQRLTNRRFFGNPKRIYRLLRAYPKPHLLPLYLPMGIERLAKGLFGSRTPPPPHCFPGEQELAVRQRNG
jgi:radical SAM superfamily enzyme YgiQ (UPF0313 family)